ncbi:MAG: hypothetical protein Q4P66_09760 [Actinomycetaceae bacterium]|nr:hypothetical protein [Actinomycetaceae bacterium]
MKLMRKLIAPTIVTLIGVVLVVTGTLYLTVWRPSGVIEATTPKKTEGNFVVSRPGVLELNAQTAHVSVKGKGDVFIAIGRSTDVTGWVGGIEHSEIVGLESDEVLAVEKRDGQKIDAPVEPAPTEEDEENTDDKAKDQPQGLTAEQLEVVKAPQAADTWQVLKSGKDRVAIDWPQKYGYWSLIAYSPTSTPQVSIMWKTPVSIAWVTPLILAGALLIVAGLVWIIIVTVFARKKHKQQREATPSHDGKESFASSDNVSLPVQGETTSSLTSYEPQVAEELGVGVTEGEGVLASDTSDIGDLPVGAFGSDGKALDGEVPALSGMAEPEIAMEEPISEKERQRAEKKAAREAKKAARAQRKAERAQRKAQAKAEKLAAKEQAKVQDLDNVDAQQDGQGAHNDQISEGEAHVSAHFDADESAQFTEEAPVEVPNPDSVTDKENEGSAEFPLEAAYQEAETSYEPSADTFSAQDFSADTALAVSFDDIKQTDTFAPQDFVVNIPSDHDVFQTELSQEQSSDTYEQGSADCEQSLTNGQSADDKQSTPYEQDVPASQPQETTLTGEFALPLTAQDFAAGKVPSRRELREARRRGEAVLKVGDKEFPTGLIPIVQPPAEPVVEPAFDDSADFPQRQPYVKDGSAPIPAAAASFDNTQRPNDSYLDPQLFGIGDISTGSEDTGISDISADSVTPLSQDDTVPAFDSQSYTGAVSGSYVDNWIDGSSQPLQEQQSDSVSQYQTPLGAGDDYASLFDTGVDSDGSFNRPSNADILGIPTVDDQWSAYPSTDATGDTSRHSGADYLGELQGADTDYSPSSDKSGEESLRYHQQLDESPSFDISYVTQDYAPSTAQTMGTVPEAPFGAADTSDHAYHQDNLNDFVQDPQDGDYIGYCQENLSSSNAIGAYDSKDDEEISIDDFQGDSAFTKGKHKNDEGTF